MLLRITLPLVAPAIAFAAVLIFLLSLGEIGVPMYLRFPVYPVETLTQFAAFYDFRAATVAAAPLLLVTLVILGLQTRLHKRVLQLGRRTPRGEVVADCVRRLAVAAVRAGAGIRRRRGCDCRSALLSFNRPPLTPTGWRSRAPAIASCEASPSPRPARLCLPYSAFSGAISPSAGRFFFGGPMNGWRSSSSRCPDR